MTPRSRSLMDGCLRRAGRRAAGTARGRRRAGPPRAARDAGEWLRAKVKAVDERELRLDVTTLWCFASARWTCGFYASGVLNSVRSAMGWEGAARRASAWRLPDGTGDAPLTVDLGFSGDDVVDLTLLLASGSALSIVWVVVGTLTGQFTSAVDAAAAHSDDDGFRRFVRPTFQTLAVAAPSWQVLEQRVIYASFLPSDLDASAQLASSAGAGAALAASMLAYRAFCWRAP